VLRCSPISVAAKSTGTAAPARPAAEASIVTITTFGVARQRDAFRGFGQRLHEVRAALRTAPGLRAEFELNAVEPAFADPCTVTLWRSEADAMNWAYRQAPH
jgi:heme-degrading monooxygenase HmoA